MASVTLETELQLSAQSASSFPSSKLTFDTNKNSQQVSSNDMENNLRRHRLEGYAIVVGFEHTWQEVKELIEIADHTIAKYIRKTCGLDVSVGLYESYVGKDRCWVQFEAERQIWKAFGRIQDRRSKAMLT